MRDINVSAMREHIKKNWISFGSNRLRSKRPIKKRKVFLELVRRVCEEVVWSVGRGTGTLVFLIAAGRFGVQFLAFTLKLQIYWTGTILASLFSFFEMVRVETAVGLYELKS